jgi:hypothetical protein
MSSLTTAPEIETAPKASAFASSPGVHTSSTPTLDAYTKPVSTSSANAPSVIKPGALVRVVSMVAGLLRAGYGIVTSSSAPVGEDLAHLVGEDGEPFLSVMVFNGNANTLASNPAGSFTLYTQVAHESASSVGDGKAGLYYIDVLPAAGEAIDLDEIDLPEDVQASLSAVEKQRKLKDNVGAGPVRDPDVEIQGATATDVARASLTGVKVTAANSTGSMGMNKVALDGTGTTKKLVSKATGAKSTAPASVDDDDSNITGGAGTGKVIWTASATRVESGTGATTIEPASETNAVAAEPLSPASLQGKELVGLESTETAK